MDKTTCTFPDCGKRRHARGYCVGHARQIRDGEELRPLRFVRYEPGATCSIAGCDSPVKARGWCNRHWRRWSEHGDPEAFLAARNPPQCIVDGCSKKVQAQGYCYIHYHGWRKYGDPLAAVRLPASSDGTCTADEPCDKPVKARGLCKNHYYQWRTHGTTGPLPKASPADRLWAKVDKNGPVPAGRPDLGPCWIWTGASSKDGYGRIWLDGRNYGPHRLSYELSIGPIPDDLVIDHLCRNPPCVNPAHLEPVTDKINILRGVSPMARNAVKTHCPQGHPYDEENTYHEPGGVGRQCKTCSRQRQRDDYQAKSKGLGLPGARTHCPQGHEYTEENTYRHNGSRSCKACRRESVRAARRSDPATSQGGLL